MKNTGFPVVAGAGAMAPVCNAPIPASIPAAPVNATPVFPPDWPARRVATVEERRRIEAALRPSLDLLALGADPCVSR